MNSLIKYIFAFFICLPIYANAAPKIDIKTGILIDFHTDKVLYELEPDMSIYPASMTKIMTSIIAFDLIKSGDLSLDEKFIVSEKAWRLSTAGYLYGPTISI